MSSLEEDILISSHVVFFFLTRQARTGTPALQNNNETLQALFSDVCGSKKNATNRGDGDLKENLLYDYE